MEKNESTESTAKSRKKTKEEMEADAQFTQKTGI